MAEFSAYITAELGPKSVADIHAEYSLPDSVKVGGCNLS